MQNILSIFAVTLSIFSISVMAEPNWSPPVKQGKYFTMQLDGKSHFVLSEKQFLDNIDIRKRNKALLKIKEKFEILVVENEKTLKLAVAQKKAFQKQAEEYKTLSDKYEKLKNDNQALLEKYRGTLKESVGLNDDFSMKTQQYKVLADNYNVLGNKFDDLIEKYRDIAIDKTSLFNFDAGLGVTTGNGDTKFAALLGLEVRKIKIWGFFQNDNNGIVVGTTRRF